MKTRTKSVLFAVFFSALVAVSIAPTGEAQTVPACTSTSDAKLAPKSVSADSSGPLKPITGIREYDITFSYEVPAQSKSVTQIPITLSVRAEQGWAIPTLDKTKDFVLVDASSGQAVAKDVKAKLTVVLSKDAPAFAQQNIVISYEAGAGTCITPVAKSEMQIPIKAGFYERYQARFEKTIWKTGQNSQIQIPLTVENFGNGPIQIRFKINEQTSGKLNLAPPGIQIIQSTISGGDTNKLTIPIDVQTPFQNGYENRRDQLVLDIEGSAADDTALGLTPLQLNAVIQTQGVYVPGFEAVTMLTALLGAILVSRRLRA